CSGSRCKKEAGEQGSRKLAARALENDPDRAPIQWSRSAQYQTQREIANPNRIDSRRLAQGHSGLLYALKNLHSRTRVHLLASEHCSTAADRSRRLRRAVHASSLNERLGQQKCAQRKRWRDQTLDQKTKSYFTSSLR